MLQEKVSSKRTHLFAMLGGKYQDDNLLATSLIFAIRTNCSNDRCTLPLFNLGNYKIIK